jgi:hypothetical protein
MPFFAGRVGGFVCLRTFYPKMHLLATTFFIARPGLLNLDEF